MDRARKAKNLLIEIEAIRESAGDGTLIGRTLLLELVLRDAETLVREVVMADQLREELAQRRACRPSRLLNGHQLDLWERVEPA